MVDDVRRRIEHLGYDVLPEDEMAFQFAVLKVTGHIAGVFGVIDIPSELMCHVVDMACGEFLLTKKRAGGLENFDAGMAIKQIQEGDTSVTFDAGGGSQTQKLDTLINHLLGGRSVFKRFRRLEW